MTFAIKVWTVAGALLVALASGQVLAAENVPRPVTNSIGMPLVRIPAGQFMMGAEADRIDTLNQFLYCDPRWLEGEFPRHPVRISKSFYLGQCEVTLAQFLTFYHEAKYKLESERDGKTSLGYAADGQSLTESRELRPWAPGWKIEMDHPVVFVSWNDAEAFCEWLSKREGRRYRLPTEAEWEYACRAGTQTCFNFGKDPEELVYYGNVADHDRQLLSANVILARYDDRGNRTPDATAFPFLAHRDGYAWTAPVGRFRPNPFGLHDMHGNVWEWCSDWYDESYYGASPQQDPQGPSTGRMRRAGRRIQRDASGRALRKPQRREAVGSLLLSRFSRGLRRPIRSTRFDSRAVAA